MGVEDNNPDPSATDDIGHEDSFSQALAASQSASAAPETAAAAAGGAAAAPQSSPAASAAPAQPASFRDLFKDSGLKIDQFKTDKELVDALLNERKTLNQYAQGYQQFAPHAAEFYQWQAQQKSQQQQPQSQQQQAPAPAATKAEAKEAWDAKKHFASKWNVPAYDPKWDYLKNNGLVELDERGLYVPVQGAELTVAPHLEAMNAHRAAQAEQMQQLFQRSNPLEYLYESLLPAFQQTFKQDISQQFAEWQAQQQAEAAQAQTSDKLAQWDQANAAALYTHDLAGNQVFTPAGEALMAEAESLMAAGITDPIKALEYAAKATGFKVAGPAQAQAPAQTVKQKNEEKISSFMENAARRAAHAPSVGAHSPYTNNPDAPISVDEGELSNFFTNALAEAGG